MTAATKDLLTRIDLLYNAYMDPAVKGRDGRFRRLAEALIEGWPEMRAAGKDAERGRATLSATSSDELVKPPPRTPR